MYKFIELFTTNNIITLKKVLNAKMQLWIIKPIKMYKDVCFDMYVYVFFFKLITVLCICMYGLCPCACVAYDLIKIMLMLLCTASRAKNLESSLNWTFRLVLWVSGLERLHIHSPRPYDLEQACSCNQSNVASKFFLTSSEYVSIWLKHFFAVAFHSLSP